MKRICTVGTQGMTDGTFISLLKQNGADAVVDIRLRNEGHRYRFASGSHIRCLAEQHGIGYLHELAFAPTDEMLKAWRTDFDWPDYVKRYRALINDRDMPGRMRERLHGYSVPCLMCTEHHVLYCHRRLLGEELGKVFGVEVVHLWQ